MKFIGFYYLDYPDGNIKNAENAKSLMYVEIEEDGFPGMVTTVAVNVYTYRFIEENYIKKELALIESNFILTPTISPKWMEDFLNQNIESVFNIGDVR